MEYMPEVIQVIPTDNFEVYVYFDDGSIHLYDARYLIKKGFLKFFKILTCLRKSVPYLIKL